jgi:hypothetical protein
LSVLLLVVDVIPVVGGGVVVGCWPSHLLQFCCTSVFPFPRRSLRSIIEHKWYIAKCFPNLNTHIHTNLEATATTLDVDDLLVADSIASGGGYVPSFSKNSLGLSVVLSPSLTVSDHVV